jgi:hypothetical protein
LLRGGEAIGDDEGNQDLVVQRHHAGPPRDAAQPHRTAGPIEPPARYTRLSKKASIYFLN